MKRASVACATFALLGTAACGSSNPTVPPGVAPEDASSERGPMSAPDLRPFAVDLAGADQTGVTRKDAGAPDAPLTPDGVDSQIFIRTADYLYCLQKR